LKEEPKDVFKETKPDGVARIKAQFEPEGTDERKKEGQSAE